MPTTPQQVRITEVGPRDGLQNESRIISAQAKIAFVNLLSATGVAEIEVSSFVSPKWIPQLGDAAEVLAGIKRAPGVVYSALVPNEKGMDAALSAGGGGVDKVAVFTAASETFSQKNTNASIAQTLERFKPVTAKAKRGPSQLPVRAYISCAVACPYEGPTPPSAVRDLAAKLLDLGVDEIDLGDTIGVAFPRDIDALYEGIGDLLEPRDTTLHLHDTHGRALDCAARALQLGVRSFDASCAGIGGCPYAPGASGNVATEGLVSLCNRLGNNTGVDLAKLDAAVQYISSALDGQELHADRGPR